MAPLPAPRILRKLWRRWSVPLRVPLYALYEQRIARDLRPERLPRHVAVMMDGNRRWARQQGAAPSEGHRAGRDNIVPFLGWCEELGIDVVTLWLLSTDNLRRDQAELGALLTIIEDAVRGIAATGKWRVNAVGSLDLLPDSTRAALADAGNQTKDIERAMVNVAVGYGGRQEIADAVRAMLREAAATGATVAEVADAVCVDAIAAHLYTKGIPDPDLVIRTSGEIRVGGFLLWQSTHSELYFCEAFWPDFRRVDFLRAVRDYGLRQRRFGT